MRRSASPRQRPRGGASGFHFAPPFGCWIGACRCWRRSAIEVCDSTSASDRQHRLSLTQIANRKSQIANEVAVAARKAFLLRIEPDVLDAIQRWADDEL